MAEASRPSIWKTALGLVTCGLAPLGLGGCVTSPRVPPDPALLADICALIISSGEPGLDEPRDLAASARIAEMDRSLEASGQLSAVRENLRGDWGRCPQESLPWKGGMYLTEFVMISPDRTYAKRWHYHGLETGPCFYEKVEQRWRLIGCRVDFQDPSLVT